MNKFILIAIVFNILLSNKSLTAEQIISFNLDSDDNTFGSYIANLLIPSLGINAQTNITASEEQFNTIYNVSLKVKQPYNFDISGHLNISDDFDINAKVFDASVKSFDNNVGIESRSLVKKYFHETSISTNLTFADKINNINAFYNLSLKFGNSCPTISLFHRLVTVPQSVLYFESDVQEKCDNSDDQSSHTSQMDINIDLESDLWHLANAKLGQIFKYEQNHGWETMTATHPLMDIAVNGNWSQTTASDTNLSKRAMFVSKIQEFIPSFEVSFNKFGKHKPNQLVLTIFKQKASVNTAEHVFSVKNEL